jgi:spore germination protein YaaH
MRKAIFIFGFVIFLLGFWSFTQKVTNKPFSQSSPPTPQASPTDSTARTTTTHTSLFVPYWGLQDTTDLPVYDTYIYFGITPTQEGINTKDAGYLRLNDFVSSVNERDSTLLTLRMLDNKINSAVLKDSAKQSSIIAETIAVAKENGFDGVVLDLELSALPFDSLIQQINNFVKKFSTSVKQNDMQFSMTIYGDVFYRVRPFDVKTLAGYSDQIMIMAYDLHKANSNPGPNFPLKGNKQYGYDYTNLVDQYTSVVPPEKLTVIFGLFGYDWPVDDKNIAQGIGKARSVQEIQQKIVHYCSELQCSIKRDVSSGETTISYISDGTKRTVWYEDMESSAKKQEYLKTKGISNFSYWAFSYF